MRKEGVVREEGGGKGGVVRGEVGGRGDWLERR